MRTTMTFSGMSVDDCMELVSQIELISGVHATGFTYLSDGRIEVHFDENDEITEIQDYSGDCKMCGGDKPLNDAGYCSWCWQIWNS